MVVSILIQIDTISHILISFNVYGTNIRLCGLRGQVECAVC